MKKRILAMLLALAMVLSLTACGKTDSGAETAETAESSAEPAAEETPIVDEKRVAKSAWESAESFSGGTGTESDPYQIATPQELARLAEVTSHAYYEDHFEEYKAFQEAWFVLTADIALNDTATFDTWSETAPAYGWTPIGGRGFEGHLDGQGHTISGLYVYSSEEGGSFGLFDEISSGATVKDLKLENAYVVSANYGSFAGLLAGKLWGQYEAIAVSGITASGVVEAADQSGTLDAGGIVGHAHGDSSLSDCTFSGTICNADVMGGIAGLANCVSITSCTSSGEIILGDFAYGGGIAGELSPWKDVTTVENCTSDMDMTDCTGDEITVGGIIGDASLQQWSNMIDFETTTGDGDIAITNCVSSGTVGGGDAAYGGGIVGTVSCFNSGESNLVITGCTNMADVRGTMYAGGITSEISTGPEGGATIENSVNEGSVLGGYAGGIVGYHIPGSTSAMITDCQNAGSVEGGTSAGGIAGGVFLFSILIDEENMKPLYIEKCGNAGEVRTLDGISGSGGIVGGISGLTPGVTCLIVEDCANTATLSALNSGRVGGILGTAALILLPEDGATDIPIYCIRNCANTADICILEGDAADSFQVETNDDETAELESSAEAELTEEQVDMGSTFLILGSSCLGGIVGYHKLGTIEDCVFSGKISYLEGMTALGGIEDTKNVAEANDEDGIGAVTGGGICGTYYYLSTSGSTVWNTGVKNCMYNEAVSSPFTSFFDTEGTVSDVTAVSVQEAESRAAEILKALG